jgi:hypothetical protein
MKSSGINYRSPWLLVILLILGGICGSLLGDALSGISTLNFLHHSRSLGLPVTRLDLGVISLTLGFTFQANLMSLLGFVAAFLVYKRL